MWTKTWAETGNFDQQQEGEWDCSFEGLVHIDVLTTIMSHHH